MDRLTVTKEQMKELVRLRDALKDVSFDEVIVPKCEIGPDGSLVNDYLGIIVPVCMGTMYEADNIIGRLNLECFCADAAQCNDSWEAVDEYNSGIVDGGVVCAAFDEFRVRG